MTDSSKFTQSLDLDELDEDDKLTHARRLQTYSVDALRCAVAIDRVYVRHSSFTRVVGCMERLFQLAPEVEMPHGMLLTGDSGVGKTAAFKFFRDTLPQSSLFVPGAGVLGFRCPKRTSVGYLVGAFLRAFKYQFTAGTQKQLYARRDLVFDAIKQKRTRLVFIDEAQSLVHGHANATHMQSEVSDFLRELMDECHVGLVLSGAKSLDALDKHDPALAARTSVRETLEPFVADGEWLAVLRAFASQSQAVELQLLMDPTVAKRIHVATRGNIRSLKLFLTEVVLLGFDQGQKQITQTQLNQAFPLVFGHHASRANVFT